MPRVSVLIPLGGAAGLADQAIDSIRNQTFTDCHAIVATGIREALAAGPEFVAFLRPEDLASASRLEHQVRAFNDPSVDACFSDSHRIDRDGRPFPDETPLRTEAFVHPFAALIAQPFIRTSTFMIRSRLLQDAGESLSVDHSVLTMALDTARRHALVGLAEDLAGCRMREGAGPFDCSAEEERRALRTLDRAEVRSALQSAWGDGIRATEEWIWFLQRAGGTSFETEWTVALQRHPLSKRLFFIRGVDLYQKGRHLESMAMFDRIKNSDPAASNNFAVLLASAGYAGDAMTYFLRASRVRPAYTDPMMNLEALRCGGEFRFTDHPVLMGQPEGGRP